MKSDTLLTTRILRDFPSSCDNNSKVSLLLTFLNKREKRLVVTGHRCRCFASSVSGTTRLVLVTRRYRCTSHSNAYQFSSGLKTDLCWSKRERLKSDEKYCVFVAAGVGHRCCSFQSSQTTKRQQARSRWSAISAWRSVARTASARRLTLPTTRQCAWRLSLRIHTVWREYLLSCYVLRVTDNYNYQYGCEQIPKTSDANKCHDWVDSGAFKTRNCYCTTDMCNGANTHTVITVGMGVVAAALLHWTLITLFVTLAWSSPFCRTSAHFKCLLKILFHLTCTHWYLMKFIARLLQTPCFEQTSVAHFLRRQILN